jgi:hypothetical protein
MRAATPGTVLSSSWGCTARGRGSWSGRTSGRNAGFDDPPVGTIVLGHEQVIYLGNGEWQPLADKPNP